MPENRSDDRIRLIEHESERLGLALGFDLGDIPAYSLADERGPYPELTADEIRQINGEDGKRLLARTIDHTLLKPEAGPEEIVTLCNQAVEHDFYAVCVNGVHVAEARRALGDSNVRLAAVVGFPLGQMAVSAKAFETVRAVQDGAGEIDMVINVGWLKAGMFSETLEDIRAVVDAGRVPVKVIIETALLTDSEIICACLLSLYGGAAFVKTSTGFASGGATAEHVSLMRASVGNRAGVKASGGIRSREDALTMLSAGANRIGTSSGIQIVG